MGEDDPGVESAEKPEIFYKEEADGLIWRLVFSGIATLGEIERFFSMDDIVTANLLLIERQKAEEAERQKIKREQNGQ